MPKITMVAEVAPELRPSDSKFSDFSTYPDAFILKNNKTKTTLRHESY